MKGASIEKQKQFWTETFQDAGWQTPRFLEGMKSAVDFYSQEVVKIEMKQWYKGRVVLLGDAGYCASPFSGMGTSLALVGAYVLAGELEKNKENVEQAIENYDQVLRPFVTKIHSGVKGGLARIFLPDSKLAIFVIQSLVRTIRVVAAFISWTGISKLFSLFSKKEEEKKDSDDDEEEFGWKIPFYPNMNLKNNHKKTIEIGKNEQEGNLRQRKGKKEEGDDEKVNLVEEKKSKKSSNCTIV